MVLQEIKMKGNYVMSIDAKILKSISKLIPSMVYTITHHDQKGYIPGI